MGEEHIRPFYVAWDGEICDGPPPVDWVCGPDSRWWPPEDPYVSPRAEPAARTLLERSVDSSRWLEESPPMEPGPWPRLVRQATWAALGIVASLTVILVTVAVERNL